jgi:Domain of unknown function (4846)
MKSQASILGAAAIAAVFTVATPLGAAAVHPWRSQAAAADTLEMRIAPPTGFKRVAVEPDSWGAWLRGLPMKPPGAPVLLYTGARKWRQDVHAAVIDIDVGTRDLQQCADAIMRLRAEWLFSAGRTRDIGFNYTDGKRRDFASRRKTDYASFRKYMDLVFAYAGTYSLEHELKPAPLGEMQIGNVFIKGGFPGHAVLVADMAENIETGEKRFLLVQSYMPAQEMHVLKNPGAADGSPWYPAAFAGPLVTPEWTFPEGTLRRWPGDARNERRSSAP